MIGAIIGDIVGSRFEFNNHRSTAFDLFDDKCTFTDDTVMTIAVADAIMSGRPFGEMLHDYGSRYPGRGYGSRFLNWIISDHPEPYNSLGNGSAMRVAPCALLAGGNRERALNLAAASAMCTHNHPEGIKGAMTIADIILMAYNKADKADIKRTAEKLYGYRLDFTIEELRPHYRFDETCPGSVPQAIEAFLESHDYESAIRLAVSLGGDSDTIADIAGGMAEAYYGVPDDIIEQGLSFLPEEMVEMVRRMYDKAGRPLWRESRG